MNDQEGRELVLLKRESSLKANWEVFRMKCYICGGAMKQTPKDVEGNWKGRTMVFKGIAPWVCENCGEKAYDPADVDVMQSFIRGAGE
jgi:YgiT-type zinc finger domain-containing protein